MSGPRSRLDVAVAGEPQGGWDARQPSLFPPCRARMRGCDNRTASCTPVALSDRRFETGARAMLANGRLSADSGETHDSPSTPRQCVSRARAMLPRFFVGFFRRTWGPCIGAYLKSFTSGARGSRRPGCVRHRAREDSARSGGKRRATPTGADLTHPRQ
jgi:hypothetical protein